MSGLSCHWHGDNCEEFFYITEKFSIFNKKRRKRCCSCNQLINIGALCLKFDRYRHVRDKIEEKIYGYDGEIRKASMFMCEPCGEIYLNLSALGYCVVINDSMTELLEEYHELTGFKKWSDNNK